MDKFSCFLGFSQDVENFLFFPFPIAGSKPRISFLWFWELLLSTSSFLDRKLIHSQNDECLTDQNSLIFLNSVILVLPESQEGGTLWAAIIRKTFINS